MATTLPKTEPYKAVYAFVLAALTSASVIWTDIDWLPVVLAAVTAIGVYIVPNPPKEIIPPTARTDGPTTGDPFV